MSVEIKVPTLGESVTEATVGQWFKKVGDKVAADEPLVELETDKVTIEVPAPSAGVLEAIAVKEGETVNVGGLLGALGSGAAAAPAAKPAAAPAAKPAAAPKAAGVAAPAASPAALAGEQTAALELNGQPGGQAAAKSNGATASPSAQKLMAENGIAGGTLDGSGKRGQVLKEDVLSALSKPVAGPDVDADRRAGRGVADLGGSADGGAADPDRRAGRDPAGTVADACRSGGGPRGSGGAARRTRLRSARRCCGASRKSRRRPTPPTAMRPRPPRRRAGRSMRTMRRARSGYG